MNNNIWGPSAWLFLHSVTFQYPEEPTMADKENYKHFFNSLQNILPCPKCREHYQKNIQEFPIQLNSRDELIQWLINIHNNVNKLNNKDILSYEDVKKVYLNSYNYSIEKDESVESNMTFILAIILVILIIYYFFKNN
tara:strand:- start:375 stop:788 length:414 start_codon:yes stop_codon:yes gene_type:complete